MEPHQSPGHNAACLRCSLPRTYVGRRQFHAGKRWGVLGDLGEVFIKKEVYDVYACLTCGSVEFFLTTRRVNTAHGGS